MARCPLLDALQGAYPLIEMVIIEATTTSLLPQLRQRAT